MSDVRSVISLRTLAKKSIGLGINADENDVFQSLWSIINLYCYGSQNLEWKTLQSSMADKYIGCDGQDRSIEIVRDLILAGREALDQNDA